MFDKYNHPIRPQMSHATSEAIEALNKRYDQGVLAAALTLTKGGRPKYGESAVAHFAIESGMSMVYVYDSRRIANRYTRKEFDDLISLCRKHDYPMGPSHVLQLVKLRDREVRARLLGIAARNRWSEQRLYKEVTAARKLLAERN